MGPPRRQMGSSDAVAGFEPDREKSVLSKAETYLNKYKKAPAASDPFGFPRRYRPLDTRFRAPPSRCTARSASASVLRQRKPRWT